MSLSEIDAKLFNERLDFVALYVFRNGFELHYFGNLRNSGNHRLRYPVVRNVANKASVDFENIDLEILEVCKLTQACAKVIK